MVILKAKFSSKLVYQLKTCYHLHEIHWEIVYILCIYSKYECFEGYLIEVMLGIVMVRVSKLSVKKSDC